MRELSIGQHVFVRNEAGIIRFIGETQFAPGKWVGVELQNAQGKNDGTVNDVHYFDCENKNGNRGVFVREILISFESLADAKPRDVKNLENIINKLQDKLRNANSEILVLKQKIEDLEQTVGQHQSTTQSLESKLEMAMVDKEFLEESKNEVTRALKELQQMYNELQADFQIMQEEVELNRQIEEEIKEQMKYSDASLPDTQTILLRNKLLEAALAGLRKLTNENELNLKKEIESLNQRIFLNEKEIGSHNELLRNLAAAQETIESLQSQLDSALQLEKMIEHLNIENGNLSLEVKRLAKTVDELTELHELDKSLEENQALVEKDLRQEINNLSVKIRDNESLILDINRKNKYMELKITELRTKPNNDVSNYDDNLSDLQLQLELLQLEFRKAKSSNAFYKMTYDLINSKLEILKEYMVLPNSAYKEVFEILVTLKKIVAITSIVRDNLGTLIDDEASHNKSALFHINNRFNSLRYFLKNIFTLWEYNYDNEKYNALTEKFTTRTSELLINVETSALALTETNYEKLEVDYITDFLLETTEEFDLQISSSNTDKIFFQNAACIKFLLEFFSDEAEVSATIINSVKGDILPSKDEKLNYVNEQLEVLLSKILNQKTNFRLFIDKLNENFKCGNDANVYVPSIIDFHSFLVNINEFNDTLTSIFRQIENEYFLVRDSSSIDEPLLKCIFGVEPTTSRSKLDSLLKILESRESFMKIEVLDSQKLVSNVHAASNNKSCVVQLHPKTDNFEKELQIVKPKYAEISTKLLEKEKLILELKLNIKFLQNSLESTSNKNNDYINKIKDELEEIKNTNESSNQRYQETLRENHKLEKEIDELLKSNPMSAAERTFNKFTNMQSENLFNKNMVMLDEIKVLRKLVKHDREASNPSDFTWLQQSLVIKPQPACVPNIASKFERSSSNLRDISKNGKLVNICNDSLAWRPKAITPKYMVSSLEEMANNYIQQRNLAFP